MNYPSDSDYKAVLLAEGADRSLIACARSLHENNTDFIIALPQGELSISWQFTRYSDYIYDEKVPKTDDINDFKQKMLNVYENIGPLIIFPMSDNIINNLMKIENWPDDIVMPIPDDETYNKLSDKKKLCEMCDCYGIETPEEYDELTTENLPLVAKPKRNFDDEGNRLSPDIIKSKADIDSFVNHHSEEDYFYQNFVNGQRYDVFILNYEGGFISYGQKVILQQPGGGSVIKASPYSPPKELVQKIRNMLEDINFKGVAMFEFISDENGIKIIESNPRFWGPLQLCVDNNVHFPKYLYDIYIEQGNLNLNSDIQYSHGYQRLDGYFIGIWRKMAGRGTFSKYSKSDDGVTYSSIWARSDTYLATPLQISYGILYPLFWAHQKRF